MIYFTADTHFCHANIIRNCDRPFDDVHNSAEKYPDFGEKLQLLGLRAFNVGVDVNDFYPVSLTQIINL